MRLVDQWREIARGLPDDWGEARFVLTVPGEAGGDRVAELLGPINPVRRGTQFRFYASRGGTGPGLDTVRRLLARLDTDRIEGTLELAAARRAEPPPAEAKVRRESPVEQWDAAVAALPSDWSDVYAEIELRSTDDLERAALLAAPLNPSRFGEKPGFRFRVARRFGYGASPGMVRRCLERLDEEGIRGTVRILHALSDTRPVSTQGPVWYVGGKVV